MSVPFLITGLPRSRTAWMAAFFSTSDSMCFHDLSRFVGGPQSVVDHLRATGTLYAGDSDSGLMFDARALCMVPEDVPVLLVQRDPSDVESSLRRLFGKSTVDRHAHRWAEVLSMYASSIAALRRRERVCKRTMFIRYHDISDLRTMRRVWDFLMPEIPWDPMRWDLYRRLHIEVDMTKYEEVMPCPLSGPPR